jgi:hypothetical protein
LGTARSPGALFFLPGSLACQGGHHQLHTSHSQARPEGIARGEFIGSRDRAGLSGPGEQSKTSLQDSLGTDRSESYLSTLEASVVTIEKMLGGST